MECDECGDAAVETEGVGGRQVWTIAHLPGCSQAEEPPAIEYIPDALGLPVTTTQE